MVSGNTQPNSLEQQLDTPCSGACCSMPCQRRLVSRRDARGVKKNLVRRLFALLDIFQPPTPATDPPFPLLCVEKMTILSFAVPPSSPAPYSSRPGTASKTAAPLGPTARTTTDRRAQPFSPRLLRRSSSTCRPVDDWHLPCTRIFENSKKILRRARNKKYFRKWQAPQKKNLVFPKKSGDRTPVLSLDN